MTKGTDALQLYNVIFANHKLGNSEQRVLRHRPGTLHQVTRKAQMESDLLQHRPHLILSQEFDL